jgi:uncharacterized membrane protein
VLHPFGADLINQPNEALQACISATLLAGLPIVEAENLYIFASVLLNAACAYALAFDVVRDRRLAVLTAITFGGSPYVAARLSGHFHLLSAWVVPLFALCLRRALRKGSVTAAVSAGACVSIAAYSAYDHVLYLAVFALTYTIASPRVRDSFWYAMQALMIVAATSAVLCLPLIVQAFRLVISGRSISQPFFWRAPRGLDALVPVLGNPFHPVYGSAVANLFRTLGLDGIEGVGWIGLVPVIVLVSGRGKWLDREEARRWMFVLVVSAICALSTRAMVGVYLALGMLMALRLASARSATITGLIVLMAFDYLYAPIPLTRLDRPAVYEQLASIDDGGAVIEVPFRMGDGRPLYYATIHGHPVVGGYVHRMPPTVAQAYAVMPVIGNLLRLSNGADAIEERASPGVPFRYLVLDTREASPDLIDYVRSTLDIDLIASDGGKELYAVQGMRPPSLRASR